MRVTGEIESLMQRYNLTEENLAVWADMTGRTGCKGEIAALICEVKRMWQEKDDDHQATSALDSGRIGVTQRVYIRADE
jgi:hypothetical protein